VEESIVGLFWLFVFFSLGKRPTFFFFCPFRNAPSFPSAAVLQQVLSCLPDPEGDKITQAGGIAELYLKWSWRGD
jgi:hypothetical protein